MFFQTSISWFILSLTLCSVQGRTTLNPDVTSKPGVTHGNVPQQEVGEEPEPEVHEELVDQTKRGLEIEAPIEMLSYGLDSDESSERIGDLYSSDLIYHDDKSLEENVDEMKYGGHHDIARKPDNDNGDASDEKKHDEV